MLSPRTTRLLAPLVVALGLAVPPLLVPAGAATAANAHGATGVLADPPANVPAPALLSSSGTCHKAGAGWVCPSPCAPHLVFGYNASPGCLALAVSALDRGRSLEHLAPLALPRNFARLTTAEQVFVLVNLERISRGVPPLVGLSPALDTVAAAAARAGTDASPSAAERAVPARAMSAAWAGGSPNAVAAVFGWIYDDGWAGRSTTNLDCTAPGAAACWGHRRVVLGAATGTTCRTCIGGSAYVDAVGGHREPSYALVIEKPTATAPALTFTWNHNVLPYLTAQSEKVRAAAA